MKALIIREPWISLILSGEKTWEMRSTNLRHRGLIGLIRQGSGLVVGVARVTDCLPALSREAYAANFVKHRIPPAEQAAAFDRGWRVPWVLSEVRALSSAVPYRHKSGAQSWVVLAEEEAAAVTAQLADGRSVPRPAAVPAAYQPAKQMRAPFVSPAIPVCAETSAEGARAVAFTTLTGGNIRNGHINLRPCRDLFPADAFGGGNRSQASPHPITVTFDPGRTVETDIAGDKILLRERGAVRDFFERTGAQEGDCVRIERFGPRQYRFTLAPSRREDRS